jgi:hypothetical protein
MKRYNILIIIVGLLPEVFSFSVTVKCFNFYFIAGKKVKFIFKCIVFGQLTEFIISEILFIILEAPLEHHRTNQYSFHD